MDHDSIANTGVGKTDLTGTAGLYEVGEADPTGTTGVYHGSHSISGNVTTSGATCRNGMWYNGVTHYETNRYNGVTDYEINRNSTSHSSVTHSAVSGMTHSTDDGQQGDLLWDGSVMESPDGKVELHDQFTTGADNSRIHDENYNSVNVDKNLSNSALIPHEANIAPPPNGWICQRQQMWKQLWCAVYLTVHNCLTEPTVHYCLLETSVLSLQEQMVKWYK